MVYKRLNLSPKPMGDKEREKLLGRLRRLAAQGASVEWAGRRWLLERHGLVPADRKWGEIRWKELGVERMAEVERRVREARLKALKASRELQRGRW